MDFKERFKGRTTNMKKEGFMETFAATTNPVTKSQSNSQLPSASKISSTVTYDFQAHNIPSQRHIAPPSVENRTHAQGYPPHSYSKSPVGHSQNQNTSIQQNSLSHSNSAVKNPYLVSNPFPSYYVQDNQQENYENGVRYNRLNPKNIANQINNQQPMLNNEFNPNNFYNQHSQFRKNDQDFTGSPLKENMERQGYGYGNTNQLLKKNFEDLSQQNKQKRLAGEALRGFDNQNTYYQMPSNQYGGYDHVVPEYSNPSNNPGFPVNGYNGPRNIHSNPVPHEHLESDAFGYAAGNVTHQISRGRQQENYTEGSKTLGYSKTSYKPYNLREYKDLKKAPVKLGGLGANINTEEWQKTKEKKDRMAEFSQNVKMFNAQRTLSTESAFKPRKEKEKEISKREVALQFAKNIPKPRAKRDQSQDEEYPDMELHKSKSDKPVHYGGHNDLDEFEQRHMQYLAQLERMKLN